MAKKDPAITKHLYFSSLTGIRAIAAYLVFFVHYNPFANTAETSNFHKTTFALFSHFHIGVSIFFVLSGFLITIRYKQRVQLKWAWAILYFRNRFARIYPLFFLITICTAIASQINIEYDPTRLWQYYTIKDKIFIVFINLTLLRGFFDRYLFSIVGQGWSLTVEECFYLTAPFLILGLRRKKFLLLLYPVVLLSIGFTLTMVGSIFRNQLFGFFGSIKFMLNWTYFGRCLEFIIGMGLAIYIDNNPHNQYKKNKFTIIGATWIGLCLAALIVLEWNIPIESMGSDMFNWSSILVRNVVLPFGISIMLYGIIHEKTWFKNMLETKLFDLLGKSSYAFYLIHGGILNIFIKTYITNNIYSKFIITNFVAILIYLYIENPIHKKLTSNIKNKI